jgi:DUF1009 family protein
MGRTTRGETGQPRRPERFGLLAGWGRYPIVVAQALKRQGLQVFCLGVAGHADGQLAGICDGFRWIGLGKLGRAIRFFRRNGVEHATMAGKIHKRVFFRPWFLLRHLPDLRAAKAFFHHFVSRRKDCRDDTLLGALVNEFAADGICFGPATDYVPELLVNEGQLTRRGPSSPQQRDIAFGWKVAKEIGRLDIGQSVAVKDQVVLAVEAVEGTDECIRRAGGLCRAGGFTVVKVAKPQQDMRFDVPTIGLGTLQTMIEAGGRVLAVEAERTIVIDRDQVLAFAERNKLVIVALREPEAAQPGDAQTDAA